MSCSHASWQQIRPLFTRCQRASMRHQPSRDHFPDPNNQFMFSAFRYHPSWSWVFLCVTYEWAICVRNIHWKPPRRTQHQFVDRPSINNCDRRLGRFFGSKEPATSTNVVVVIFRCAAWALSIPISFALSLTWRSITFRHLWLSAAIEIY